MSGAIVEIDIEIRSSVIQRPAINTELVSEAPAVVTFSDTNNSVQVRVVFLELLYLPPQSTIRIMRKTGKTDPNHLTP
jgi:hypothetical protein